jgi:hypothetical protein
VFAISKNRLDVGVGAEPLHLILEMNKGWIEFIHLRFVHVRSGRRLLKTEETRAVCEQAFSRQRLKLNKTQRTGRFAVAPVQRARHAPPLQVADPLARFRAGSTDRKCRFIGGSSEFRLPVNVCVGVPCWAGSPLFD